MVVEGLPSIAGDAPGSAAGGVDVKSLIEISSATPSLSTWKLNSPKAMSKPSVTAETAPAGLEAGLMMVVAGVRSTTLGDAVSMTVDLVMSTLASDGMVSMTAGTAMPTLMIDAVSMSILSLVSKSMVSGSMLMSNGDAEWTTMADDEPSNLVDLVRLAVVGEGAGESVDPDPVVPTVGAN
jgi:hypothetical protein